LSEGPQLPTLPVEDDQDKEGNRSEPSRDNVNPTRDRHMEIVRQRRSNRWHLIRYAASMRDCILVRVSDHCWTGTLRGWRVWISEDNEGWHLAIGHAAKKYTRLCFPVRSFADGARRARAWIEIYGAGEL
jgi:hypothetical protein